MLGSFRHNKETRDEFLSLCGTGNFDWFGRREMCPPET